MKAWLLATYCYWFHGRHHVCGDRGLRMIVVCRQCKRVWQEDWL